MKPLVLVAKGFCLLSGLLMAPTLLGVGLAYWMGFVPPWEKIRAVFAESEESSPATEVAESSVEAMSGEAGEARLWESRLTLLREEIDREGSRVEADRQRLEARGEQLDALTERLAVTLTTVLDRKIEPDGMLAQLDGIDRELEALDAEEKRFPELIETLRAIDPGALASIVAGTGGEGLSERQALRVLRGLPARRSAQVLEEMSKVDPVLASSLVELMGRGAEERAN